MTPRIVVTSGDPATGVATIEAAPDGVSLPATVEVAKACSCDGGDYTTSEGEVLEHVGGNSRCGGSGFVVLGTATLYCIEHPGVSVVAYLTDWNPT